MIDVTYRATPAPHDPDRSYEEGLSGLWTDSERLYVLLEMDMRGYSPNFMFEPGRLVAYDLETREALWSYQEDDFLVRKHESGPAAGRAMVHDGRFYIATQAGLQVIDCETGQRVRHYPFDWSFTNDEPFELPRNLLISDDGRALYWLGAKNTFYCFDLETGQIQWSRSEFGSWAVIQGQTIVGLGEPGLGSKVKAISATDGELLWQAGIPASNIFMTVVGHCGLSVSGNSVFVIASDVYLPAALLLGPMNDIPGGLYLAQYDLTTGAHYRNIPTHRRRGTPTCSDGLRLWAGDRCIDLVNGRSLWESSICDHLGDEAQCTSRQPVLIDGVLLTLCVHGLCRGISADDGHVLWEIPTPATLNYTLLAVGPHIVLHPTSAALDHEPIYLLRASPADQDTNRD